MRSVCSAMGRKSSGAMKPTPATGQRIKVSAPMSRPVRRSSWGWKYNVSSRRSIAERRRGTSVELLRRVLIEGVAVHLDAGAVGLCGVHGDIGLAEEVADVLRTSSPPARCPRWHPRPPAPGRAGRAAASRRGACGHGDAGGRPDRGVDHRSELVAAETGEHDFRPTARRIRSAASASSRSPLW